MKLKRSLLQFGKIDAKNEILNRDANANRFFVDSFTLPNTNALKSLLDGSRFIVYGHKGTGKTALLRYVRDIFDDKGDCTKFVLFSEDVSDAEKNRILN